MPAGYTHYQFSEDVIYDLPNDIIKNILIENKELFQIGTHGPDIFFYHKFYNFYDKVNRLGKTMHNENAREFFEKAINIIDDNAKLSYILGFLCHFILDSQMHFYVKKIMKETDMSHFEVEAEYDRYLLKKKNLNPIHCYIYSHITINEHIVCTIQSFFSQLSYLEIQESLKSMKFIDRVLRAPSYFKRTLLYILFHFTFHFKQLQGLIINYHHNIKMEKYYSLLDHIYQNALNEAIEYIQYYYQNLSIKEHLPARFDKNYK